VEQPILKEVRAVRPFASAPAALGQVEGSNPRHDIANGGIIKQASSSLRAPSISWNALAAGLYLVVA